MILSVLGKANFDGHRALAEKNNWTSKLPAKSNARSKNASNTCAFAVVKRQKEEKRRLSRTSSDLRIIIDRMAL